MVVSLKAHSHDVISCTKLFSNSLIRNFLSGLSTIVQKNRIIHIALCELAFTFTIIESLEIP